MGTRLRVRPLSAVCMMAPRSSDGKSPAAGKHRHDSTDSFSDSDVPDGTVDLHHPRDPRSKAKYNVISRVLFLWLDSFFCIVFRRSLQQTDLYANPEEVDSKVLLDKFNTYWAQELERKQRGAKARIYVPLFKCVWWRLVVQSILMATEIILVICQAKVLGYISDFFIIQEPTAIEIRNAYLYAAVMVLLLLLIMLVHAHGFLAGLKIGMIFRVCTTAAVYQKILRLSQSTVGRITIGYVVNVASNDVHRFDWAFVFLPFLLISPFHVILFTYLAYVEVGWPAFLATVFVALQIPLQIVMASLYGKFRTRSASVTDHRVRVMNEVITGIRVIKMYAWEYAFKNIVTRLRRMESLLIFKAAILRACNFAFFLCSVPIAMYIVFVAYTLSGGVLSPRKVFTVLVLLYYLRLTSVLFFVANTLGISEGSVAFKRIQALLELDELPALQSGGGSYKATGGGEGVEFSGDIRLLDRSEGEDLLESERKADIDLTPRVKVKELLASWNNDQHKTVLNDISFEVNKESSLLAVIGSVGSGKSTLLQCLLGELRPVEGSVEVTGKVSFSSQDPWIFSASLRDNILFGLPYRRDWYNTVITACALDKDMSQLVQSDLTLVGERGVTLSGGQKARVALARAVYSEADVYFLDDPLSAVDTVVGKHLFKNCIRGLLKGKLVVLVTHQLQFARQADKILALNDGKAEAYGSLQELLSLGVDPTRMVGIEKEGQDMYSVCSDGVNEDMDTTENSRHVQSVDDVYGPDTLLNVVAIYPSSSMLSLHSIMDGGSSRHEDLKQEATSGLSTEEKAHGSVSAKTYYHYFRAGGNIAFILFLLVLLATGQASLVLSDWWLSNWAECSTYNITDVDLTNTTVSELCRLTTNQRIAIYTAATVITVLLGFARCILIYFLFLNASRVVHNRMFGAVLRAPVHFFDTNPSGRVLNRFSKDVGFLDDILAYNFLEFVLLTLRFISVILTTVIAIVWLIFPVFLVIVLFVGMRWYYLKTAREVKRLEAIARSPIYSHVSTTLQGLPIIRSFGRQAIAMDVFHKFHNEHSQAFYLSLASQRWFTIRIDTLSVILMAFVAFLSVALSSSYNAALLGLSLAYIASLAGAFQYMIRISADIENLMISAERVMEYGRLQPEAALDTLPPHQKPPPGWPRSGAIKMEDVSFRYSEDNPLVLKSLSLTIQPGEKIGIVGRTGAGKSSLIAVLFRMAESFGVLSIDGIDTKDIGLHDLRKKISIIPQDPVLFSGTLQYNLDPFEEYSDVDLWSVLEQVQMKSVVEGLEGGLHGQVSEGGSNFSVGQRQLMCLARALLRKNKILVLDEATANVDLKTDEIIQLALREKFQECTVLTIAHRLNTIMDSDRILVLNAGQVVEFDSPYALMQRSGTLLCKMVEQTGPFASRKLHQMAVKAHMTRSGPRFEAGYQDFTLETPV